MSQIREKRTWESVLYDFDCSALLDSGETITGVPVASVDQVTSPALTFGTASVNAAPASYPDGHTAPIGKVVQVLIGGGAIARGQLATIYIVRMRFSTSLGNQVEATVKLLVQDQPN